MESQELNKQTTDLIIPQVENSGVVPLDDFVEITNALTKASNIIKVQTEEIKKYKDTLDTYFGTEAEVLLGTLVDNLGFARLGQLKAFELLYKHKILIYDKTFDKRKQKSVDGSNHRKPYRLYIERGYLTWRPYPTLINNKQTYRPMVTRRGAEWLRNFFVGLGYERISGEHK